MFAAGTGSDQQREQLWQYIEQSPDLDWLLLTAHPDRARTMFPQDAYWRNCWGHLPGNVWVGLTVNSAADSARIPELMRVPAKVRFVLHEQLKTPIIFPFAYVYRKGEKGLDEELFMCKRCGAGVWDSAPECSNCHSDALLEWSPDEMLHWVVFGLQDARYAEQQQWEEHLISNYHQLGIPCYTHPGCRLTLEQVPESDTW